MHIQPEAPAKPALGQPCNGCGVCCLWAPCPVGMVVSLRTQGACRALHWSAAEHRYRCGLLMRAQAPWLRALLGRWIAAGSGCDASIEAAPPGPS